LKRFLSKNQISKQKPSIYLTYIGKIDGSEFFFKFILHRVAIVVLASVRRPPVHILLLVVAAKLTKVGLAFFGHSAPVAQTAFWRRGRLNGCPRHSVVAQVVVIGCSNWRLLLIPNVAHGWCDDVTGHVEIWDEWW